MADYTDLRVRTGNPTALDETVQILSKAVVIDGSWDGDTCLVRVFGDPGFLRYAITHQGYGEIVDEQAGASPLEGDGS